MRLKLSIIDPQRTPLIGIVSYFIACKYEEVYPPKIGDIE
jgi:hypothetical protein